MCWVLLNDSAEKLIKLMDFIDKYPVQTPRLSELLKEMALLHGLMTIESEALKHAKNVEAIYETMGDEKKHFSILPEVIATIRRAYQPQPDDGESFSEKVRKANEKHQLFMQWREANKIDNSHPTDKASPAKQ